MARPVAAVGSTKSEESGGIIVEARAEKSQLGKHSNSITLGKVFDISVTIRI